MLLRVNRTKDESHQVEDGPSKYFVYIPNFVVRVELHREKNDRNAVNIPLAAAFLSASFCRSFVRVCLLETMTFIQANF